MEQTAQSNWFELFGLPPRYQLDLGELERRYRELALLHHPDRQAGAQAGARRVALERTADLNEAFRVLKDPVRRAGYLLRLQGINLEDDPTAPRPKLPVDFLEEVLELREGLQEAGKSQDLGRVLQMAGEVAKKKEAALQDAVAALEAQQPTIAAQALGRVRYYARFLEEVEAIEEESLT